MSLELLHISTTTACNLRCRHCAVRKPDYHGKHMEAETFEALLPVMHAQRPAVQLNGHGETLMHPGFAWMFDECAQAKCDIAFQTNGVLLAPLLIELFQYLQWRGLTVSLDGATDPVYSWVRGVPLARVQTALDAFARLRPETQTASFPRLTIEFCAMGYNVRELLEVVRLAKRWGACRVVVSDLTEYPGMEGQRLTPAALRPYAEDAIVEAGNALRVEFSAVTSAALGLPVDLPAGPCRHPWRVAFVDVDGNVSPCCRLSGSWGNVRERAWADVWDGPEARAMREAFEQRGYPAECRGCMWVTGGGR